MTEFDDEVLRKTGRLVTELRACFDAGHNQLRAASRRREPRSSQPSPHAKAPPVACRVGTSDAAARAGGLKAVDGPPTQVRVQWSSSQRSRPQVPRDCELRLARASCVVERALAAV